ncbi:SCN10A [Symbiodinium sp. CCMP2456]|nr:SCN10A [Symbiodinium sp. CCMP2456]
MEPLVMMKRGSMLPASVVEEILTSAAAASAEAPNRALKRRVRQRLHKKLGSMLSSEEFEKAIDRYKVLEEEQSEEASGAASSSPCASLPTPYHGSSSPGMAQGNSASPANPATSTSPTFIAVPMMMPMTTMQPLRFLPTAPSQPLQLQMRPMQPLLPQPLAPMQQGPQAFSDHSAVAPKAQNGPHERSESTSQTTDSAIDDDDLESISELSTEWARAVSYGSSVCPVERTFIQFHTRVAGRVEKKFQRHGSKSRVFLDAEEMKAKVKEALARPSYNVFDFYHRKGFFQWVAKSNAFETVTLVVIGINALWLAHDTNSNQSESLLSARIDFQVAEIFFCTYYAIELFVRFMAFRRKCDSLRDGWFVFDSLLVLMMLGETVLLSALLLLLGPDGPASTAVGNASILRLFRLLRLSRMARMLRSMPELMILIKGMAAAATSVFFVMCLQLILLYVFAIAFTQLASGTFMGDYYFPDVLHSMYTLLLYGTFLDNLSQFCDEVGAESPLCLALIFVFVLLSACTVLNMLIGILCEVVSAVAAVEREEILVLHITNKLQRVLSKLDKNNDGHLCKAEFMKILQVDEAARALEEVGVDPVSIVDFADFIFGENDGEEDGGENLSFGKFMEILLTLRAENKSTIRSSEEGGLYRGLGFRGLGFRV